MVNDLKEIKNNIFFLIKFDQGKIYENFFRVRWVRGSYPGHKLSTIRRGYPPEAKPGPPTERWDMAPTQRFVFGLTHGSFACNVKPFTFHERRNKK